ncbi:hypothetical protein [Plantibacter sp. YIM 135249]|uniref:hypothetical protein n=1 Tax=Plantibacter sp. YIM 135249 TaxID=3423918 RepID=UPI003D33A252
MRITTAGRFAALTGGAALVVGTTLALAGPAFAAPSEVQVTGDQIAPTAKPYTGWHEGYDAPGARATVTAAGLNLAGRSQIINGLAQPITVDGTSQKLSDIVAGTGFTSTNDAVHYQIAIYATIGLDGAANTDFATLRPAVPGQTGLKDLWVSSKNIPVELPAVEPTPEPTETSVPTPSPSPSVTSTPEETESPADEENRLEDDAPKTESPAPSGENLSTKSSNGFSVKTASVVTPKAALADGVIIANTPTTLADLDAALGSFQIIAFGVLADKGVTDTVQTVSFGGTVYRFNTVTAAADPIATPAAAPVKRLSNTGAETTPLIAGGAVLLAAGLAAMAVARKRRQQA